MRKDDRYARLGHWHGAAEKISAKSSSSIKVLRGRIGFRDDTSLDKWCYRMVGPGRVQQCANVRFWPKAVIQGAAFIPGFEVDRRSGDIVLRRILNSLFRSKNSLLIS